MADGPNDPKIDVLIEAVYKLTVTAELVASSLAKIESLYIDMLQRQAEDRIASNERLAKMEKRHDEQQEKWNQSAWQKNPWKQPRELAYLSLTVAIAALAIATVIFAKR